MNSNSHLTFLFLFGISLHLAALSQRIQIDVKLQPDQVRSKREMTEVDVVLPMRITADLSNVVSSNHFRRRRSVQAGLDAASDEEFSNPAYKIRAFETDFIIRLEQDEDLVAPSFTTTYSWKNKTSKNFDSFKQSSLQKCFYKGTVVGLPSSQVALSICDSLTGTIYTDDYHYSITPVTRDGDSNENGLLPHSIERRSIGGKRKISDDVQSSCGVNEARNQRRYKRTFMSKIEEMAHKVAAQAKLVESHIDVPEIDKNVIDFEFESKSEPKVRSKRSFVSRQHYIETMVVVDGSMVRKHGEDLEHYILSIMMIANQVFSHPSLGSAISLSVVKVMIIEDPRDGPRISSNAANTLRDFCTWQRKYNSPDDSDPAHYDLAVLLTSTDFCGDTCDTLGMAEVGAMCSTRHSCAIVEDDGLSASYTLAHEVGHVLNMMHDDNRMCRENFAIMDSRTHVMSSTMSRIDSARPWSACSRQAVIDFLQDKRGECLLDKPQKAKAYPKELPGAMYDVNAQCAMSFGTGATECPYMRECSRLWCQLPSKKHVNQCHTRNFPRADGSECAPDNHCMQGKCVRKVPQLAPINGGWGSWSQFSSCSRSCGGGIHVSNRQCNNPAPQHGGKYCIGSRLQFRSCNTDACPSRSGQNPRDFRSEQCADYNGQRFPLLGVRVPSTWIPKYADVNTKDRCKLICQSVQTGSYITLSDRVVDGTRCGLDTTDVCVHGQCMPAGCDGILGSKAKYNKCGLCNSSNSQCKRIRGKYNKRQPGYNDVVTLPIGAASIKIQQRGFRKSVHDGNYLALVNSAGRYLLNGALTLSTIDKDIEVNGTVLQYTGVRVATEKILSVMPLKEPITVQVLSLGLSGTRILPPRIKYTYYIAQQKAPKKSKIHRTPKHKDVNVVSRRILKPERSETQPSSTPKRSSIADRWVTGRWGRCKTHSPRKCGSGWRKRKVTCKNGKRRANGCNASMRPYHRLPCFVSDCPTVSPILKHNTPPFNRKYGPSIVNRYRQNNERPIWNAGMWGPCSTSCGLGTKRRNVMCQTTSGRLLSTSACFGETRPSHVHGCKLRNCP